MAKDSRTYFEEAKKSIEDAKNSLESYKNLFSDVKDIEEEYHNISKKFDNSKRNRLKQLSNKKNLTKAELSEKRKLLELEKRFIELQKSALSSLTAPYSESLFPKQFIEHFLEDSLITLLDIQIKLQPHLLILLSFTQRQHQKLWTQINLLIILLKSSKVYVIY